MNYYTITALIPFYDTSGHNITCVLFNDGSKEYIHTPLKSFIHEMLISLHLDPKTLTYWSSKVVGHKKNLPLIITEKLIFLPIKVRHAYGKNDGCFGYVNNGHIATYDDTSITFTNQLSLPTFSPRSYIMRKQTTASLLGYAYASHKKQYEFMLG